MEPFEILIGKDGRGYPRTIQRLTDWSQARIARELAVDAKTVTNWKVSMELSIDRQPTVIRAGCPRRLHAELARSSLQGDPPTLVDYK